LDNKKAAGIGVLGAVSLRSRNQLSPQRNLAHDIEGKAGKYLPAQMRQIASRVDPTATHLARSFVHLDPHPRYESVANVYPGSFDDGTARLKTTVRLPLEALGTGQ
jgi:hypothetical protein